jgi:catechol 2,3-dioxygenase-like lactoylglutathione lyase family enzyme
MTLSVHHIALNAAEPQRLAQLYRTAADFQLVEESGGVRWVAAPNLFIALHPAARPIGPAETGRRVCDPGITHFCVQSGDGQRLWDAWSQAGLDFNGPPVALGTGATYAYGRDPECNVIEAEGIAADPDAPAWIAHVALATASLDGMTDFYARSSAAARIIAGPTPTLVRTHHRARRCRGQRGVDHGRQSHRRTLAIS